MRGKGVIPLIVITVFTNNWAFFGGVRERKKKELVTMTSVKVIVCALSIVPLDSTYLLHTYFTSTLNLISLKFLHMWDFLPTRTNIRSRKGYCSFGRSYLIYLKKEQLKPDCIKQGDFN